MERDTTEMWTTDNTGPPGQEITERRQRPDRDRPEDRGGGGEKNGKQNGRQTEGGNKEWTEGNGDRRKRNGLWRWKDCGRKDGPEGQGEIMGMETETGGGREWNGDRLEGGNNGPGGTGRWKKWTGRQKETDMEGQGNGRWTWRVEEIRGQGNNGKQGPGRGKVGNKWEGIRDRSMTRTVGKEWDSRRGRGPDGDQEGRMEWTQEARPGERETGTGGPGTPETSERTVRQTDHRNRNTCGQAWWIPKRTGPETDRRKYCQDEARHGRWITDRKERTKARQEITETDRDTTAQDRWTDQAGNTRTGDRPGKQRKHDRKERPGTDRRRLENNGNPGPWRSDLAGKPTDRGDRRGGTRTDRETDQENNGNRETTDRQGRKPMTENNGNETDQEEGTRKTDQEKEHGPWRQTRRHNGPWRQTRKEHA
ncbi:protein RNA-directed DNA methylation 3-like [Haliotis rubra]|uniref:protein RNA-directed DNA methylation 3-like n=1 Tax=Haliotis rubra TaxID=36100 RepID=UPI001EE5EB3B|nr:protein RNA-directed DNA methylation 3-like [Haliotis rubra]